jgi:Protein of unknown function (DUF2735)
MCDAQRLKETAMNTSFNQGSARIYQFPVGGRSALGSAPGSSLGGRRQDEIKTSNEVAVGGAWYHDAAIQESKPVRER